MTTVTTRFAPSPTGYIHVGNLRTALMNYLITRKAGGTFILRLDDTDQERSKQEYIDGLVADLDWLGIRYDRVEQQSKRMARYAEAAEALKAAGRFYECFETPVELDLKRKKLLNMGRPPVYDRAALSLTEEQKAAFRAEGRQGYWRFRLDQERIEWTDGIIGPISIDAASVSDPVLIKADGQVLYTFASSVDDVDMGVTHIVRGADHVTNTATQIQIMKALGGTPPTFAHHSLLTGPQGEELSKRLGTLSLRDLRLTLNGNAGKVDILRGITLEVPRGQSVGLIGPSGSGKSSLLMCLGGLERPTGGTIRALGQDLAAMGEDALAKFRRDNMGIVFQSFHLIPTMTALENVAVPLELMGAADAFARAEAELRAVGLAARMDHYPSQMSGGEQQRVALARAAAPRPAILLADEPTGNLDGVNGQAIMDLLFGLRDRHGATLVLVTHAAELAARHLGQVQALVQVVHQSLG